MIVRQEAIDQVYSNLIDATNKYYAAQMRRVEAKFAHDATYETGLVSGEIVGKNEAERAGVMRQLYPELVLYLQRETIDLMGAEMAYKVCQLEKERVKLIVQIELEQKEVGT